jgi:dipeptidase E
VLFLPYALFDLDAYAEIVRARFARLGIEVFSIHRSHDPAQELARAGAVFVGGGNTFRLLKALYDRSLLEPLVRRIEAGAPYIGSSAGANIAGPTIQTTNDMPIVVPPSLISLGLVPFNINPHYIDKAASGGAMVESRDERIGQFLEENTTDVLALSEATYVRREDDTLWLEGVGKAKFFRRDAPARELWAPADISFLLKNSAEPPRLARGGRARGSMPHMLTLV